VVRCREGLLLRFWDGAGKAVEKMVEKALEGLI
jgi:hypothetical protein